MEEQGGGGSSTPAAGESGASRDGVWLCGAASEAAWRLASQDPGQTVTPRPPAFRAGVVRPRGLQRAIRFAPIQFPRPRTQFPGYQTLSPAAKPPQSPAVTKDTADDVIQQRVEVQPSINSETALSCSVEHKPSLPSDAFSLSASVNWSQSLQRYVARVFERAVGNVEKDHAQNMLREKIRSAANAGLLNSINWDEEELPSMASVRDRLSSKKEQLRRSSSPHSSDSQSPTYKFNSTNREYRNVRSTRRKRHSSESSDSSTVRSSKSKRRGNKRNSNGSSRKTKKGNKPDFFSPHGPNNAHLSSSVQLQRRANRFSTDNSDTPRSTPKTKPQSAAVRAGDSMFVEDRTGVEWSLSHLHIVGTCQNLEKQYLRLTSAPDACSVRPPSVLKQSLQLVKDKWLAKRDYHSTCDQLKSIRQDLTVQGIRDDFTIHVYETHARIALEKRDHTEFNQCQTQLAALYNELTDSAPATAAAKDRGGVSVDGTKNRLEFTAYRIIYFMYTRAITDINTTLAELSAGDKADECLSHALQLRSAWSMGNYVRFFRLYKSAPKMSGYLIDWFIDRERKNALKILVKAYRPSLPVPFVSSLLACSEQTLTELTGDSGALVFTTSNSGGGDGDGNTASIDCKASLAGVNAL